MIIAQSVILNYFTYDSLFEYDVQPGAAGRVENMNKNNETCPECEDGVMEVFGYYEKDDVTKRICNKCGHVLED